MPARLKTEPSSRLDGVGTDPWHPPTPHPVRAAVLRALCFAVGLACIAGGLWVHSTVSAAHTTTNDLHGQVAQLRTEGQADRYANCVKVRAMWDIQTLALAYVRRADLAPLAARLGVRPVCRVDEGP